MSRKKFLGLCVAITAFSGLAIFTYPFFASWHPNAASQRIFEINVSKIEPGSYFSTQWNAIPIAVYRPNQHSKEYLISLNDVANGPDYELESFPELFVYIPISTHLRCNLVYTGPEPDNQWMFVGLADPCTRGFWDLSGRLIPSVNAGYGLADLESFEYIWATDSRIRISRE